MNALQSAVANGASETALYFSGEYVHKIKEILPVKTVFDQIKRDFALAAAKAGSTITLE